MKFSTLVNPNPIEYSRSLQVGKAFLDEYKKVNPKDEIIEIDVYSDNITLYRTV
ncbi:MAG: hypothetical protein Q8942_20110 [Bacillota bacterium]|nr:hypothetical protein [Bacillota bacterium]